MGPRRTRSVAYFFVSLAKRSWGKNWKAAAPAVAAERRKKSRRLIIDSSSASQLITADRDAATSAEVGRTPRSAADALVGLFGLCNTLREAGTGGTARTRGGRLHGVPAISACPQSRSAPTGAHSGR